MFPGARDGSLTEASYAIIGAPLENTPSFYPGARFGPNQIRHFAKGFEDFDHRTSQHFTELDVIDLGDVHAWSDSDEYISFLTGELTDIVDAEAFPVLLGGEHTVSLAGVQATNPAVYITVDAHLDLRASYDGDPWSHATVTHHIRSLVDQVVILGARAGCASEWERVQADPNVHAIEPEEVDTWLESQAARFLDQSIYCSIDIDGIDPGFAPATGTREPFGLRPETVRDVVRQVAPATVGMDIVEVTDRDDGQTATLAAKLLRDFIFEHAGET